MYDMNSKPRIRDDISVQDMGEEVVIYDNDSEKIHVLNHTAHAIWKLCDGGHTVADICVELASVYPDAGRALNEDIVQTITDFQAKNLLI